MLPEALSSTRRPWSAPCAKAGSPAPDWTSSRTSRRSTPASCPCRTSSWRRTSRAHPAIPGRRWRCWLCATASRCSRGNRRSHRCAEGSSGPAFESGEAIDERVEGTGGRAGRVGAGESVPHDPQSCREIAFSVLVVFGQLLPRRHVEGMGGRRLPPQRARLAPAGLLFLPSGEPEANPVTLFASEPGFERPLVIRGSAPRIATLPEMADAGQLTGGEVGIGRESTSKPSQQRGQRQHVVPVVLEHPGERGGAPVAKELEIECRDEGAGDVVFTDETEHLALERR